MRQETIMIILLRLIAQLLKQTNKLIN